MMSLMSRYLDRCRRISWYWSLAIVQSIFTAAACADVLAVRQKSPLVQFGGKGKGGQVDHRLPHIDVLFSPESPYFKPMRGAGAD